MNELLINGKDAKTTWGVTMGSRFMSALRSEAPMKEYISNNSRLEHGVRYLVMNPKMDERKVTLEFRIKGLSVSDYEYKKDTFLGELMTGAVDINVPSRTSKTYHLLYRGNGIVYGENRKGTFGHISVEFTEPNPSNRQ